MIRPLTMASWQEDCVGTVNYHPTLRSTSAILRATTIHRVMIFAMIFAAPTTPTPTTWPHRDMGSEHTIATPTETVTPIYHTDYIPHECGNQSDWTWHKVLQYMPLEVTWLGLLLQVHIIHVCMWGWCSVHEWMLLYERELKWVRLFLYFVLNTSKMCLMSDL